MLAAPDVQQYGVDVHCSNDIQLNAQPMRVFWYRTDRRRRRWVTGVRTNQRLPLPNSSPCVGRLPPGPPGLPQISRSSQSSWWQAGGRAQHSKKCGGAEKVRRSSGGRRWRLGGGPTRSLEATATAQLGTSHVSAGSRAGHPHSGNSGPAPACWVQQGTFRGMPSSRL